VLYTSGDHPDWPDALDRETGLFTYFGDNRRPGRALLETPRAGNAILEWSFNRAHGDADQREQVAPFLVFAKANPAGGRSVRFLGLAVPGGQDVHPTEDLVAIWRIQAQMVSDIAGLYGKEVALTRAHMVYCLFRHATSQVARDVVVRAGERLVIRQVSGGALRSVLTSVGMSVTQRVAGTAASRWLPVIGAAAVAGYAYWDTLQVAKTAISLLETTDLTIRA
jgi:uncharacterized protein (DUF697 family)